MRTRDRQRNARALAHCLPPPVPAEERWQPYDDTAERLDAVDHELAYLREAPCADPNPEPQAETASLQQEWRTCPGCSYPVLAGDACWAPGCPANPETPPEVLERYVRERAEVEERQRLAILQARGYRRPWDVPLAPADQHHTHSHGAAEAMFTWLDRPDFPAEQHASPWSLGPISEAAMACGRLLFYSWAQRFTLALAALLLAGSLAAEPTTPSPKPPRSRPAAQITVKVWPSHLPAGKLLALGSVTPNTCTAWIAQDTDPLWTAGLQACRAALAKKGGRS